MQRVEVLALEALLPPVNCLFEVGECKMEKKPFIEAIL